MSQSSTPDRQRCNEAGDGITIDRSRDGKGRSRRACRVPAVSRDAAGAQPRAKHARSGTRSARTVADRLERSRADTRLPIRGGSGSASCLAPCFRSPAGKPRGSTSPPAPRREPTSATDSAECCRPLGPYSAPSLTGSSDAPLIAWCALPVLVVRGFWSQVGGIWPVSCSGLGAGGLAASRRSPPRRPRDRWELEGARSLRRAVQVPQRRGIEYEIWSVGIARVHEYDQRLVERFYSLRGVRRAVDSHSAGWNPTIWTILGRG